MDESALERYFDWHIADDASHTEEEGALRTEEEEERNEDQDKQFFKLLPDELLTLTESGQDKKEPRQDRSQGSEQSTRCSGVASHSSISRRLGSTGKKFVPKITNVVSTVNLGCSLELDYIAKNAWNTKFNKTKICRLSMAIKKPRATGIFYETGQLVCLGAVSVEKSRVAARRFARIVQKLGFPVRFLKFEVHNLVVKCKTYPVNLEKMAAHDKCSYEPELFPSLFYKVMPGMSMIVYRSGVLSLTGAKSQADIDKAFEIALPILNYYRK